MSVEGIASLLAIAALVAAASFRRLTADLALLAIVAACLFSGYVSTDQAFAGFASATVVTMICLFVLSTALHETGVADHVGRLIVRYLGGSEARVTLGLMLSVAFFSSFMNNVAATALMLPAAVAVAERTGIPAARLMIPLSFGSVLGGMTTMIGTPPNLLVSDFMRHHGSEPFGMFDFSPFGLSALLIGVALFVLLGSKLLPRGSSIRKIAAVEKLGQLYKIFENLLSLRVPGKSPLVGSSVASAHIPELLGARILALSHHGKTNPLPGAADTFAPGDTIVLGGGRERFRLASRLGRAGIAGLNAPQYTEYLEGLYVVCLTVGNGALNGKGIEKLDLFSQFGAHFIGAIREQQTFIGRAQLSRITFSSDDDLEFIGFRPALRFLMRGQEYGAWSEPEPLAAKGADTMFWLVVPEGDAQQPNISRADLEGQFLLRVVGSIRDAQFVLGELPAEFRPGDVLLIRAEREYIAALQAVSNLELDTAAPELLLDDPEVAVLEAVLAPRSRLIDKSLSDTHFKERYGFEVLAIWREGAALTGSFSSRPLLLGDALLLKGPAERVAALASDPDFVIVSKSVETPFRTSKAPIALAGTAALLGCSLLGVEPVEGVALLAALIVVAGGAVRLEEAYRSVQWRVVVIVGALISLGSVVAESGPVAIVAEHTISRLAEAGMLPMLIGVGVLSSLLSQSLDGSVGVALLAPVVYSACDSLGINPRPFLMMVALSASIAFLTPYSHKSNMLVLGAGGYRTRNFFLPGAILSVLLLTMLSFMIYASQW